MYDSIDSITTLDVKYFQSDKSINKFDNAQNVRRAQANTVAVLARYDLMSEAGFLRGWIDPTRQVPKSVVDAKAIDPISIGIDIMGLIVSLISLITGMISTQVASKPWSMKAPVKAFACTSQGYLSTPYWAEAPKTQYRIYAPDSLLSVAGVVVTDEYVQIYPLKNYLRYLMTAACVIGSSVYVSNGDSATIYHRGLPADCKISFVVLTYDTMKGFHRKNTLWYQDEFDMLKLRRAGDFYFSIGSVNESERGTSYCMANTNVLLADSSDRMITPSEYDEDKWTNKVGWDPITPFSGGARKFRSPTCVSTRIDFGEIAKSWGAEYKKASDASCGRVGGFGINTSDDCEECAQGFPESYLDGLEPW